MTRRCLSAAAVLLLAVYLVLAVVTILQTGKIWSRFAGLLSLLDTSVVSFEEFEFFYVMVARLEVLKAVGMVPLIDSSLQISGEI